MKEHKELQCIKQIIQSYYNTTNDNGKQIISDLVDNFEMEGLNVDWMKK